MNIDLLSLAIGIPLGVALTFAVRHAMRGRRERQRIAWTREMWTESRNASFINYFKNQTDD